MLFQPLEDAPDILVENCFYRITPSNDEIHLPKRSPLLERLITDQRMAPAWKTLKKRTIDRGYFLGLYISIHILISIKEPNESPDAIQEKHNQAIKLCQALVIELKGLNCPPELIDSIHSVAQLVENNAHARDLSLSVYRRLLPRFNPSPQTTMLTRALYQRFISDFSTPLWSTIAKLVEVSLDLPINSVSIDWVRACCKNALPDEENNP